MNDQITIPSPIQEIKSDFLEAHGISLHVKREDMIHPLISGNKWRKLKYNLSERPEGIITFGGAFSNHIHATAAAGKLYHIPTVGIIRGEYDPHNPTISDCENMGMKCHFVSRSNYRLKEASPEVQKIIALYPDNTLIPEGGSNEKAIQGVEELGDEIDGSYDYIALAAGTGATARGLISTREESFLIFSTLKVKDMYAAYDITLEERIHLIDDYHFGGYGKTDDTLIQFINEFYDQHAIPLDPIYNGKVAYGLMDMIQKGKLKDCSILWIHTGGLQGIQAYNYMAQKKNKPLINLA